jgi:hypothetical protein
LKTLEYPLEPGKDEDEDQAKQRLREDENIVRTKQTTSDWVGTFRKRTLSCSLEDDLYADEIDQSDNRFAYFIIMTAVGIGASSGYNIKDVDVRLKFETVKPNLPRVAIRAVAPSEEVRVIGSVREEKITGDARMAKISGNTGVDFDSSLVKAHLGIAGNFMKGQKERKIIRGDYPNEIPMATGFGVGTDAVWQFKQGGAAGKKGQYDLDIFFRIENPDSGRKKLDTARGLYQVIPEIKINNHSLKKDADGNPVQSMPIIFRNIELGKQSTES